MLKNVKREVIGIDVDDTLNKFTEYICQKCKEKFGHEFPYEEVIWGFENYPEEEKNYVHSLFRDNDFIKNVPILDGAIEFVKTAIELGFDVVFVTATYSAVMTTRALWLYDLINFIHPRNYIMTGRKDCVKLKALFDDSLANINSSIAEIPVLINTPWNKGEAGHIRARRPDGTNNDCIEILKLIKKGLTKQEIYQLQNKTAPTKGNIGILIGGSGVGKTAAAQKIVSIADDFVKIPTNTTRAPRPGETDKVDYFFRTNEKFKKMIAENDLLEYTEYPKDSGTFYGTSKSSIDHALRNGKNVILVMDIAGAEKVKEAYPGNTYSIFISRDKKSLINSIMERDISLEEKINRIANLDNDFDSQAKCDYVVKNVDGKLDETVNNIITILRGPNN